MAFDHLGIFHSKVAGPLVALFGRLITTLVPVAGGSNVGNGVCSEVALRPFVTVAETWTLTCTLGGSSATFSVVGSVSGNIGTATAGTEFTNASSGGLKFTVSNGTVQLGAKSDDYV